MVRPENAPPPSSNPIDADAGNFERVGNSDYYLGRDGHVYKSLGKAGEGQLRVVVDDTAQIAVSDEALARTEQAPETTKQTPDKTNQAPEATKQAPDTTKQAPETTKQAPEATNQAPEAANHSTRSNQQKHRSATARPQPNNAPDPDKQGAQHPPTDAPHQKSGEAAERRKPRDTLHGTGAGDTLHDMKVPVEELNLPPGVKQALDRASIPPEERAELIDWVSKNKLSSPEAIAEYIEKVHEKTSSWHDLSPLAANADKSLEDLRSAYDQYRTRLTDRLKADHVPEAEIQNLLLNTQDLRTRFSGEPELVQTIDHLTNARDVNARAQTQLHDVVSGRA